jgi:glycerol-3-phosphate dehydrogenase
MTAGDEQTYDLFVIGGGINGAAVACDAAGRGLSVGLAEMQDFAEGTSSRSSKLIHGGLRYLETFDFRLVREALREREILMHKSPHLVWPLRFILPHVEGLRPRWMIRLGLFFYDHLARRRVLQGSESIDFRSDPAGTALKPEYQRGFAYSDCRCDDSRLVITTLLGAQRNGACIYPRHRFEGAKREGGGLWQIELHDTLAGTTFSVRSKALVNASGPWVIQVGRAIDGVRTARRLRMVRGSHIVVPRQWEGGQGYFLQTTDGRLMEAFPYERDFTLIGTTDEAWEGPPEDVMISEGEIEYMLTQVNRFFRKPITRDQVVWSYSGVRPLFEVGGERDRDLSTLTRDYSFEIDRENDSAPVLTVFGGKLTTHRRLAEHAMQELAKIMPWPKQSKTSTETLPGGDFSAGGLDGYEADLKRRFPWLPEPQLERYVRQFGTRLEEMLEGAASAGDLGLHIGADLYQREVDFLIRTEWAQTVEDIVWRRTKLGLRLSSLEVRRLAAYIESKS